MADVTQKEVFSSRDIKDRSFLFDLDLEPNVTYTYFVRVNSEGSTLRLPMAINTYKHYIKTNKYRIIISGILIGLLFFSILFNVFLFVITKDIINFYYTFFVIFLALFLVNISGLTYQKIWPDFPWWQQHSTTVFASLANIFLLLFTRDFYNFKKFHKYAETLSKILILLIVISIVLTLISSTFSFGTLLVNFIK